MKTADTITGAEVFSAQQTPSYPHTLTPEQFAIVSVALDRYVDFHKSSEHRAAIDELRKLWAFTGPVVLNTRKAQP